MTAAPAPSITTGETFLARAQRGEAQRVQLWLWLLVCVLGVGLLRRRMGGAVMSVDAVFYPSMILAVAGILIQIVLLVVLKRAIRRSVLLPAWLPTVCLAVDFCIVAGFLGILEWRSPRGSLAALSPPVLLLFPVLIFTSVLRLKPRSPLLLGIAAAIFHWMLTTRALHVSDSPFSHYPVYYSYGLVLLLSGVAGMLISSTMRGHVQEAVQEAVAREAAETRNALVQRDLAVARDIQRGLLPSESPKCKGYELSGFNRAADLTGGDYYDWQELPDGRLVAVLADVTGHGIGPALVMAVCRAYTRASAGVINDPSALMVKLNQLLKSDLPADKFITLAIAMLKPDGQAQLLSAGHGPTLLYRAATATVEDFGGDGLPLGIDIDDPYTPANGFRMQPGDVLVMLTDGFFEWHRADGEQFGVQRLVDELKRNAHKPATQIIARLDEAVRAFANGAPQQDDMTAVVVKRLAEG